MSDHRARINRARLAGGRSSLHAKSWSDAVDKAIAVVDACRPTFQELSSCEPVPPRKNRPEPVWLGRDQMVVSARMVLDLEIVLLEAQSLELELRALADDTDVSAARRERIARVLEDAIAKIKNRLAVEPS